MYSRKYASRGRRAGRAVQIYDEPKSSNVAPGGLFWGVSQTCARSSVLALPIWPVPQLVQQSCPQLACAMGGSRFRVPISWWAPRHGLQSHVTCAAQQLARVARVVEAAGDLCIYASNRVPLMMSRPNRHLDLFSPNRLGPDGYVVAPSEKQLERPRHSQAINIPTLTSEQPGLTDSRNLFRCSLSHLLSFHPTSMELKRLLTLLPTHNLIKRRRSVGDQRHRDGAKEGEQADAALHTSAGVGGRGARGGMA